jgi:hypothetical protein
MTVLAFLIPRTRRPRVTANSFVTADRFVTGDLFETEEF